jgi:hypothetical protein
MRCVQDAVFLYRTAEMVPAHVPEYNGLELGLKELIVCPDCYRKLKEVICKVCSQFYYVTEEDICKSVAVRRIVESGL